MKKIDYYAAQQAAIAHPSTCKTADEIREVLRTANSMGCGNIILIRYDINQILKWAQDQDLQIGHWQYVIAALQEVKKTTEKHFSSPTIK